MKEYWSLEKQQVVKAVGETISDAVFGIIPIALDNLNHLLFFLATQVNKFIFGAHHHVVDLFSHSMHRIINMTTKMVEDGVKDYQAER
jgi:hypothetical protein